MHSTRRNKLEPPGKIRIIGGEHRGRRIVVAQRPGLRPTPDRVRETLFNWLGQRLDGLACLDLFAGTGALGFEAVSRGAARVVMVERDALAFAALESARELLRAVTAELRCQDAFQYVAAANERFDVVFLDPPFGQNALPAALRAIPPRLAPGARVYIEAPEEIAVGDAWEVLRASRAGQVVYRLLQWRGERAP